MDITPLVDAGKKIITGYGDGNFKVNQDTYTHHIVVSADTVSAWEVNSIDDVPVASFAGFNFDDIELLLIGTGKHSSQVADSLRQYFTDRGISVEVMDTGAACRTYNVLLSEDRKVAAALLTL